MAKEPLPHPTSIVARNDRLTERENLARALRTSQMMREQAREQIDATSVITELKEIDLALAGNRDPAGNIIPLETQVISALKARAEIRFKLLSKVLPDLKATEATTHSVHDHNHNHLHAQISNVELAQRLQLWRQQQADNPEPAPATRHQYSTSSTSSKSKSAPGDTYENDDIEDVYDFL